MRRSKRQLGLLLGTALSLVMVGACAQTGDFFASQSDASASLVDHALNAARLARQNGDLDTASRRLAYLVSIAPDNAEVLGEYGKVLTEMGRPDDGIAYLNKAIARDPGNWKLYNAVAVAYDEKHDYASSSAAYDKALSLAPGNAAVLANDARSRILAGDTTGAQRLLAQANPTDESRVYFSGLESQLAAAEAARHSDTAVASAAPAQLPAAAPQASSGETEAKYRVGEMIAAAPSTPVTVTVDATPRAPAPVASVTTQATAPAPTVTAAPVAVAAVSAPESPPAAAPAPAVVSAPVVEQKPVVADASTVAPAPTPAPTAPPAEIAAQAAPPVATIATNDATEAPAPAPVQVAAVETKPVPKETPAALAVPADVKPASDAVQPAVQQAPVAPVAAAETSAPAPVPAEASKPVVTIVASQNAPAPVVPAAPADPVAPAAATDAPAAPQQAPATPAPSPIVATPVAVVSAPSAPVASTETNVALAAAAQATPDTHYFIRVGTWHSRKHARHVAAKLRPRDVHIARVNYRGRHYYRVWMAAPVEMQDALASVRSLGFMHARIIAKVDSATARKLAANKASGQLAFDFMHH